MNVADIFQDTPVDSWTPVNLAQLPDKPPIQPNLANTRLIYPGKRHVFSGPPESAKTLAAYCVLIQTVRTGKTGILIDFEMGAYDTRQRLQELGASTEELARILYLEPDERATEPRIAALIAHQPAIVVIDAAAGAFSLEGLDDNRRAEVERFTNLYIGDFWRAGIATILIDHVVKDTEHRGRYAIGSERKLGGADVHIGLDTIKPISRGTNGHYKLIIHKDRGGYHKRGHLCDLKLESDPDTHQLNWAFTDPEPDTDTEGHFRPTGLMQKVSIDLELRHEAVPKNTVVDAIGGRKKYVLDAINALVREGYATETDGPKRAKLLAHTHRYREDDPTCNQETGEPQVVPVWFQAVPGTTNSSVVPSSSQVVPGTTASGSPNPRTTYADSDHRTDHPEHLGWFPNGNQFADTYYDTIKPDTDEEP